MPAAKGTGTKTKPKGRKKAAKKSTSRARPSRYLLKEEAEPITERGRATRRKILEAAEQCFSEFGYSEASVAEIVRRSGLAQGTFYNYFDSKKEIFTALIRSIYQGMLDSTRSGAERARGEGLDRVEVEVQATQSFFDWLAEHRNMHRILNLMDEVDPELTIEYFSSFARVYAESLSRSMDEEGGLQDVDPEVLAYFLMGGNEYVSKRWILWDDAGKMPPRISRDFARIIAGALRGASS